MKKIGAVVALTAVLMGSGAAAAFATTNYPAEGGTWTYGLSPGLITPYSNYYHPSRCHGSSVYDDWGSASSINTAGGHQSQASTSGTIFTHNRYYYRVC